MNDETIAKIMALVDDLEAAAYGLGTESQTNNAWVCADYETRIDKATGEIEALLREQVEVLVDEDEADGWPSVTVDKLESGDFFKDPDTAGTYTVVEITESLVTPGFFTVRVVRPEWDQPMAFGYWGYQTVCRKEN